MHIVAPTKRDWLTRKECIAILEISHTAFTQMVRCGQIRRRDVAGYRCYWRQDVEALASPPDRAA